MARLVKERSKKVGLPPGTPVHIGTKRVEKPKITVLSYDETHLEEKEIEAIEECFVFKEKPAVTWINVDGLHQIEILEGLGECYGIHPLVLEDIANTDQRPKVEDYGDYIYIVLKMLVDKGRKSQMETEQVSLILGSNFVFSFRESGEGVFEPVRERIKTGKSRVNKMGADYLAYALLDAVVDQYFVVLEKLGERIEILEEDLVINPKTRTLREIQDLKKEMIILRKAVWPLREVLGSMERGESVLVQKTTGIYLRDVYDHAIQVIDTLETLREMVSGMLDIYLSSMSNRLNAVMKVLTIIATLFMPLTFLAGIYGMNFRYMPELEWRWGYPAVWLFMIAIGISMFLYFKRKKWLS